MTEITVSINHTLSNMKNNTGENVDYPHKY